MPVLDNAKHELFIQNIVKGMTQRQAYKLVFGAEYDNDAIDCNASKLFNNAKVKQRYEELLQQLEEESIMSAKERMKWLTDVIKNIQRDDVYIKDSEGNETLIGSKNADINTKLKAIDTLNKMDNTYQQNIKVSGNINNPFENLSEEELRKLIQ